MLRLVNKMRETMWAVFLYRHAYLFPILLVSTLVKLEDSEIFGEWCNDREQRR